MSADERHAGLVSAMFLQGSQQVACPDPEAGLWVRHRAGSFQKVLIPPDALAFQLGEASQVCGWHLRQGGPGAGVLGPLPRVTPDPCTQAKHTQGWPANPLSRIDLHLQV